MSLNEDGVVEFKSVKDSKDALIKDQKRKDKETLKHEKKTRKGAIKITKKTEEGEDETREEEDGRGD